MTEIETPIARIDAGAVVPAQATKADAGYDLYSTSAKTIIAPGDRASFNTGIAVAIPEGYVGYVKPRSGLAANYGIDVLAGVIDSGYRGEIKVLLLNTGRVDADIAYGERIAQLVVQPVASVTFTEVATAADLPSSDRGEGGFGSTGSL